WGLLAMKYARRHNVDYHNKLMDRWPDEAKRTLDYLECLAQRSRGCRPSSTILRTAGFKDPKEVDKAIFNHSSVHPALKKAGFSSPGAVKRALQLLNPPSTPENN